MATVTCHTEGCANTEQPIDLALTSTDEDGATVTVDAVVCGVCGNTIDDLGGETLDE